MRKIRENIFEISWSELGSPPERGFYKVVDLGEVLVDLADLRYAKEAATKGHEALFFVSRSGALQGDFVVVSRQQADRLG